MSEKFLCVSKVFITVDFKYEIKIEYFTKPNFASWNIQKLSNYYNMTFFYNVKGRKPLK